MGRRSLLVANVVEVLEHWAAGRPLRAIAESLGLDRNTVRKYISPAREAGFGPGNGAPPEGWAAFVARVCPQLGTARKNGAAWEELAARRERWRRRSDRSCTSGSNKHRACRVGSEGALGDAGSVAVHQSHDYRWSLRRGHRATRAHHCQNALSSSSRGRVGEAASGCAL